MLAIFKREFRSYFHGVIGWLFVAAVIAMYGICFWILNLNNGYPYISYTLSTIFMIFLLMIGSPILTMRCFSEERKAKTDQLTLTSPVTVGQIVMGKYLALVAVFTIDIVVIAVSPLVLALYGTVAFGECYVALLGYWLFGCTYLAVGMLISSFTESQVISAVLTFVVLLISYLMGTITDMISTSGNWLTAVLDAFNLCIPFENLLSGCLDLTAVVYFITVIALLCFLTVQSIQKRRWSMSKRMLSTGVFSGGFIAVAIVLTVIVNLVVSGLPVTLTSIDCTYLKLYGITDATKTYLNELEEDVTIYVLNSESNKDAQLDQTLSLYESLSKHVTVEYVDPSIKPNFYTAYTETAPSTNSLIIVSSQRSKVVDYYDIYVYEYGMDYTTYSYTSDLVGYDAEGQITSGIEYVSMNSDELPVVYQVTGHNESELESSYTEVLEKANITLESLELFNEESVPENAAAIIINGPQTDFNEEDAQKVISYLQSGGKVILAANVEYPDLENFNSILEAYGVTLEDGIVAENDANYYYYNGGPYYLLPEVESTDYTSGVTSNAYVMMPLSFGISYEEKTREDEEDSDSEEAAGTEAEESTEEAEGAEDVEEDTVGDITYTALLSTTDQSVSKTDVQHATTYSYEDGDITGPFAVALAVEQAVGESTTQLVVLGSSYFFYDQINSIVSGQNATLFTNIVSAMVGESELSTSVIPAKELTLGNLTVSAFAGSFIGMLTTIFVPIALLAVGIVIWIVRRRK